MSNPVVQFHQCPVCDEFECQSTGWFLIYANEPYGPFATKGEAETEYQNKPELTLESENE